MAKELIPYEKPYLTSAELCDKLEGQGLHIENRKPAEQAFERYSYYRFKAYLTPFKDEITKTFHTGATFEDGLELYLFDSKLRNYLFNVVEKVEIGVRSAFDQWMTSQTNNPFWYLDASLFTSSGVQIKTVSRVRDMFKDSKEEFAVHYCSKYYNQYCPFYRDLPPGWVAIELMTFGNLVNLLNNVTEDSIQTLKLNRFSNRKFGVLKFKSLCAWMNTLHQVRNFCGHHNRLFNRNLPAPTAIQTHLDNEVELVMTKPAPDKREVPQVNRLYTAICALQVIYSNMGYQEKFGPEFDILFNKYPVAQKFQKSMGFPVDWKKEGLLFK